MDTGQGNDKRGYQGGGEFEGRRWFHFGERQRGSTPKYELRAIEKDYAHLVLGAIAGFVNKIADRFRDKRTSGGG